MLKPMNSMTRAVAVLWAALTLAPFQANAAKPVQVPWERLSIVVGKTVMIAMPGGPFITGRAIAVEPDALLVDVKRTTDANAYPKGLVRVPRTTLHRFDMRRKGSVFRIVGTVVGFGAGAVTGFLVGIRISGGLLGNDHSVASAAAFVGIWAGGAMGGYFAGNALDNALNSHWTPVTIVP